MPKNTPRSNRVKLYPTQDHVRYLFDYREDGCLIWKYRPRNDLIKRRHNGQYAGRIAGAICSDGYIKVSIQHDGAFMAHRLIWIWHNGEIAPGLQIDHMDGIRGNNKIENLRAVTRSIQMRNRAANPRNTSGYPSVFKSLNRWRARVCAGRKAVDLGTWATPEEAYEKVKIYHRENGFTERHGK